MVRKQLKCIRMLPKCIDKLLNTVLATITKSLVLRERIWLFSLGVSKKRFDSGGGKLGFFHGEEDPKRKHRINEPMGIAYAEESFSGKIRDTIRVIGNAAHILDKLNLRETPG